MAHQVVLLPGLDGTAKLFERFVALAPAGLSITPIHLPGTKCTYPELADNVAARLPQGPIAVIAESFSGPLAAALAAHHPIRAFVFVNSFVVAPRSRAFRWLALPGVFGLPAPHFVLRRYLLGPTADDELVRRVAEVVASVPADILAWRVRSVLSANQASPFARITVPTLYVRGTADRLVPESALHRMAALRPITTALVPGPHLLLQVNPGGAWQAIAPFLDCPAV